MKEVMCWPHPWMLTEISHGWMMLLGILVRVGIYVIKWMIPHGPVVRVGIHVLTWMILCGAIGRIGIPHVTRAVFVLRCLSFQRKAIDAFRIAFYFEVYNGIIGKPNRCFKHHAYHLSPLHLT